MSGCGTRTSSEVGPGLAAQRARPEVIDHSRTVNPAPKSNYKKSVTFVHFLVGTSVLQTAERVKEKRRWTGTTTIVQRTRTVEGRSDSRLGVASGGRIEIVLRTAADT